MQPKPKFKRKFKPEWLKDFEWLSYDDESDLMYCTWCRDGKKKNPFGTSGSNNFQKSALGRHENYVRFFRRMRWMWTLAVMVNCTTDTLLAYKNENGPKLQQIYEDIESGKSKDLKLPGQPHH